jgi:hypothetical protein
VQHFRFVHEGQDTRPNDDSGQEFTQDGSLADPLHALPGELCGKPDEDEP